MLLKHIEEVLSNSIASSIKTSCIAAVFLMSALMWYGCLSAALELFGPYDNGYCLFMVIFVSLIVFS